MIENMSPNLYDTIEASYISSSEANVGLNIQKANYVAKNLNRAFETPDGLISINNSKLPEALMKPMKPLLSSREMDVLKLASLGLRDEKIAQRLFISKETVRSHIQEIYRILDVSDRVDLVVGAVNRGIIKLDPPSPEEGLSKKVELSPRRTEILQLISQGFIDRNIASMLHINKKSVSRTVVQILGQLCVESRAEAVAKAEALGLFLESTSVKPLLSPRRTEILTLLSKGFSFQEIGDRLSITKETVRNTLTPVLRQLGVENRTQAVIKAVKLGIISI